ncbi:MAG: diguanylate cyclase [Oscillospiraceae bacterium]|nr:diguanylate cyclase [Oscillospiraceae bacterium]
MKVKTMIMIAAICFAVIPMIVYTVLANFLVRQDGDTQFRNELRSMAQNQTTSLQTLLDMSKSDVETLVAYPEVNSAIDQAKANDKAANFIYRFVNDNPSVNEVAIVGRDGNVIHGNDAGKPYGNFEGYAEYKDNVLYFDEASGTTGANAKMFIKRKIGQGTLFVTYDISSVLKFADSSAFYGQGKMDIVDPNLNWSSGTNINQSLEKQYTPELVNRISNLVDGTPTEIFDYSTSSGKRLGVMLNVGGADGLTAIVSCPANKSGMFSNGSLSPIFAVAALLSVVSVVIVIFVAKAITSPLKKIEVTLEKIRRGDHEARIGTVSNNEYGQMSRAFNNLVDEIVVSEDRYRTISDMSDNIIFEWNFKTNEVMFSNNFNKKFSYRAPSDHFGDSFLLKAKVHPDDADRYRSDLDALEKGKNFERNEYRIKNIYGDFIWVLMRTATLKDKDGKPLKVVGVMVDIDRAKKSEQQLTERASYDALTELYNRETIESQIDNEISLSEMRKSEMAVLFIDVDDFKHYNDNYSHATGDQVLKFVAKTLRDCTDGIGFAGRYGGDEFIVMLRNAETNNPANLAQDIIARLDSGFDADIGERLTVSVSIGIAVIKDDYNTRVEYLIGKADDAMYSVKKSGKSNYAFI